MMEIFRWLEQNNLTDSMETFWEINIKNSHESQKKYFSLFSSYNTIWDRKSSNDLDLSNEKWGKIKRRNTEDFKNNNKDMKEEESIDNDFEWLSDIKVNTDSFSEAMAFYRPFHYYPYNEWGIYFVLPNYLQYMNEIIEGSRNFISKQIVATLVLYEIFHHEYYHHLVESAAFTLETILAEFQNNKRLYIDHIYGEHRPLEEALANVYAYHSISFAQRTRRTFDVNTMKAYQTAIKRHWREEPPGYCDAEKYITNNKRISGNTALLRFIMNSYPQNNAEALERIALRVLINGHTSMETKPKIPTYFLGDTDDFINFSRYIPYPKKAYAYIEFPYQSDKVTDFIMKLFPNRWSKK
jgi:hypothetical protein